MENIERPPGGIGGIHRKGATEQVPGPGEQMYELPGAGVTRDKRLSETLLKYAGPDFAGPDEFGRVGEAHGLILSVLIGGIPRRL